MLNLSIIILSYNTKALTLNCLKSIVSQYEQELENKEFEIIVVDNNSSDNSVEDIKKYISTSKFVGTVNLIESKENLGFGKGCNFGARSAKGKYILFLNSDADIEDRGLLKMVNFLKDNEKVAILGGKIQNSDRSVQPSAGKFYTLFNLFLMLLGLERLGFLRSSPDSIKKVDWVSGACMMVNHEAFDKLSGFDSELFMYIEDMELCYRAKKMGIMTYFFSDIKLRHKSFGSSSRSFAIINIYKGILHFYSKHRSRLEFQIAKTMLIFKANFLIFLGSITGNSEIKKRYKNAISNL